VGWACSFASCPTLCPSHRVYILLVSAFSKPLERARTYLELVKFEHTIFALPFAYAGMFLASQREFGTWWPGFATVLWISLAMAGARTSAMALNRVIDAAMDARNPRTSMRHVPRGAVKPLEGVLLAVVSLAVLTFAAWQLNPLCVALLPIAVVFLVLYPYTKRVTWLCHAWLGVTDGAAAAGGYIAVTGRFDATAWLLWAVVIFWMIGLDVIYATQDYDFDRQNGVRSIPQRFGIPVALEIAKWSHAAMWVLLIAVGMVAGSHWMYFVGIAIMGGILFYEHRIVNPNDLTRVNEAFFNANSWLALTMLASVVLEVVLRGA
jgi:4-hydroxybenzoate polyprenyltransferase